MCLIDREMVSQMLATAVAVLRHLDTHLLELDANERSITHRLALHIERHLREHGMTYDVDCEYNRNHDDPKAVPVIMDTVDEPPSLQDLDAKTVYPDIIVHDRGTDLNVLAVEVKKEGRRFANEYDRAKLMGYLFGLGYCFVAFVQLPVGPKHALREPTIIISTPERDLPPF